MTLTSKFHLSAILPWISLYFLALLVARTVLVAKGKHYHSCPHCEGKLRRERRNGMQRLMGFVTLQLLSFRKVKCTACCFCGFSLRSLFRQHRL